MSITAVVLHWFPWI